MSDVATVLHRLILAGELAICHRDPGVEVVALIDEAKTFHDKAADRERVVHDYTIIFALALHGATELRHDRRGDIYRRILGVTLSEIRADFGLALEQRKRPTA